MATKPTFKPEWATNNITLPVAGTDNKIRPTVDLRDNGIDYGQQLTAQEFNWLLENIKEWIDYLEDSSGVQDAAVADNADGDAVEATLGIDSYNSEDIYWIKWPADNTVPAPTLNIDGNGAITVISLDGDALEAGDLVNGRLYPFWYDGSNFVVCSVLKTSQAEAEAHTNNKQYMTALRVYQAFSQYGLGSTSLTYISDFNDAYQLETGFYKWDDSTVGEPTGGSIAGEPTVYLSNENGTANLLAFMAGTLYTATCTSSTLSSWYRYSQDVGQVIDTQTFPNVGSFTWNKPSNANPDDTVIARMWAGGGSGAASEEGINSAATGGNGGGFVELSFRVSELNSSETVEVGDGGAAVNVTGGGTLSGNDGGDSSFASFSVRGGKGGVVTTTTSVSPAPASGFSWPGTTFQLVPAQFTPGLGGAIVSEAVSAGDDSFYAGAGGGSAGTFTGESPDSLGGTSYYGGNGGNGVGANGVNATGTAGTAPGGGGGAATTDSGSAATSGAGAKGLVEIYVLRGWAPSGVTNSIS